MLTTIMIIWLCIVQCSQSQKWKISLFILFSLNFPLSIVGSVVCQLLQLLLRKYTHSSIFIISVWALMSELIKFISSVVSLLSVSVCPSLFIFPLQNIEKLLILSLSLLTVECNATTNYSTLLTTWLRILHIVTLRVCTWAFVTLPTLQSTEVYNITKSQKYIIKSI